MAVAMIYPKGHQGKKTSSQSEEVGVSGAYLSNARAVLTYSRALAEGARATRPDPPALGVQSTGSFAKLDKVRFIN